MKLAMIVMIAACVVCGGITAATPKPKIISDAWELDFTIIENLRAIRMKLPGDSQVRTFWFVIYNVTNRSGQTQAFTPDFTIYTETGKVLHAGRGVPSAVFKKIKSIYNMPLLTNKMGMMGNLLHGADNAKDGVAIFVDLDPKAGGVDLFIGGISGEVATVNLPRPISVFNPATGKKVLKNTIRLSKNLKMHYRIVGEAAARHKNPAKLKQTTWVMR